MYVTTGQLQGTLRSLRGPIDNFGRWAGGTFGQLAPNGTPRAPWGKGGSWSDFFTAAIPAVVQYQREKKVTDLQMERLRRGLPPADVTEFSPPIRIQATGGMDTKTMLMLGAGAAGLGALFLLRGRR